MASFWQQLKALLWRNILLKKRNKPQLFQELLFPVYFVILLVFVKNSMKQEKQPAMSFPAINISSFLSYSLLGGYIYVSPNTSQVKNRMDSILAELQRPISYEMFSSSKAAEAKYKSNTSRVAAGIIFDYDQNSNSYAIRMNSIYVPDTKVLFNNIPETCRSDKNGTATSYCDVNTYMHNGFTSLQLAIDKILMKELKMNTTNPAISVQLMDKPELSPKTNNIQTHSSVYFVLSFSVLANFLAVNIVAEKENKIKEGMLMMGLRSSVFWLSWTLIYFSMVVVASGLMIVVIVANKLFSQSNMFLLFLMFVLYGWSSITFAFMITPFFKKAALAGVIAGYSPVIISLVNLAVSQTREEGSYDANIPIAGQWLMCLISTIAFSTVISQGIFLDVHRTGFGFDSSLTYCKFPLYAPILMLAVDTIVYALLTVYFDHVIPGEYGIRYKPYYFLQCSYWFKSRKSDEMIHLTSPQMSFSQTSDVEAVPKEIEDKIAMRISHLTKTFKQGGQTFNAVDGFCLNIYENHITCLLGHNGAGKTTLFNMLTGFVPPTSGTAKLLQLDITNTSDLEKIRSQCGICPQHNLLYDAFSCIEHLKLFANIKGVSPNNIKQEIEAVLQDVDLTLQAGMFAKDLSGGQRRKLSVAIALIGHPKLIFLDEPTAGMDPLSRRHLWSLLKKMKAGRAILLTTHFMDEADILADRKAFMSKGKLRCCGSSLFLKNKFGIGYHLTMVVTPDCEVSLVTSLLQSKIPDVILQRSHGKEVSYTIPLKDVSKFSDLFAHLDQESNNLGIKSYGVSMATLEEVFLKLEELSEIESETDEIMTFATNSKLAGVNVPAPVQAITSLGNSVLTGAKLSRQRFKTLLWIRYLMIRRNIQVLFLQIFLPNMLLIMGFILDKVYKANPVQNPQPLEINPHLYVESSTKPSGLTPLLTFDAVNTTDSLALFNVWRNHYNLKLDVYKAGINTTSQLAPHYLGIQVQNISGKTLNDIVILYNDSALHSVPAAINLLTQTVLSFFNASASINISSLPWPVVESGMKFNSGSLMALFYVGLAFVFIIPSFAGEIVQDRELKLRGQLRISGVSFKEYWASIYAADIIVYLIPLILVLIIVPVMENAFLSSPGAVGTFILLLTINMPFYLMLALVLSFIFDKKATCVSYLSSFLNFAAVMPLIAVLFLDMSTRSKNAIIIHYVACIVDPPYIIFGGIYFILRINVIAVRSGLQVTTSDYFQWDNHFIITIILPVLHFVWMYWLLRVLDIKKTGGKVKDAFPCLAKSVDGSNNINPDIIEVEDDDVKLERTHVENLHSSNNPTPVAYTQGLRKVYYVRIKKANCFQPSAFLFNVAVRNLSLAVNDGEVIGLLGPNGAGKTTVLSMIVTETEPTCGQVIVSGYNNHSHMLSVLKFLGYCPQYDALWENITLEEHIRCFAAIKGVDPKHLNAVIDYYVSSLKLEEHRKKCAKTLSGGTKRKLSYIMSILGSPRLVLLDEPSTGMDPQSKRFLWDTISASFKKTERGAILTTHYMEEADALCDRVGIMVNGQLECLGSTQHLKSKYGSGYILEVKLRYTESTQLELSMDSLEEHLNQLFPGLQKVERFQERAQYAIPKDDVKSLGVTFSNLEKCKETHNLEEYSFSQSTLEQVFLYFAKKQ